MNDHRTHGAESAVADDAPPADPTHPQFAAWLRSYVGQQDATKMRFSVAELAIAFTAGSVA